MNTGNKPNIPTNARVKGKYKGTLTKGWARETNGKLYFQIDGGGWIEMKDIENPIVICEVINEPTYPNKGIVELTNGVYVFYGPNTQYKTKREAMAFAEAVADLCTGLRISLDELGRAMQG